MVRTLLAVVLTVCATACATTVDSAAPSGAHNPTAGQLMAKVRHCHQISAGKLRTDEERRPSIPICRLRGAVFWTADMDVDCDGQVTAQCNPHTGDCCFQPDTSFHQSDGKPLRAGRLPYIVIPGQGRIWNYAHSGINGGSIVAVIYRHRLEYAIVGDTDAPDKIGEASYATAQGLGINPSPADGGTDGPVTYILFSGPSNVVPRLEDHRAAVTMGERAAVKFLSIN